MLVLQLVCIYIYIYIFIWYLYPSLLIYSYYRQWTMRAYEINEYKWRRECKIYINFSTPAKPASFDVIYRMQVKLGGKIKLLLVILALFSQCKEPGKAIIHFQIYFKFHTYTYVHTCCIANFSNVYIYIYINSKILTK